MNGQLTSTGYIVYGYETSKRKKARNHYHSCGQVMQFNKHGVLVCPVCRPLPKNNKTRISTNSKTKGL